MLVTCLNYVKVCTQVCGAKLFGPNSNYKEREKDKWEKQKVHYNILEIDIHLKASEINNLIMIHDYSSLNIKGAIKYRTR